MEQHLAQGLRGQPQTLSESQYANFLGMLRPGSAGAGGHTYHETALHVLGALQMVPAIPKSGQNNPAELHIVCG